MNTDDILDMPRNPCFKCKGSGRFISYKGRDVGECFTCNGSGERDVLALVPPSKPGAAPVELAFPKTIDLVLRNNIRLFLGDCKIVITQNGAICLVSPQFGFGYYGTFTREGLFRRANSCTDAMVKVLQDVEARGIEAVKEIGLLTGVCCVCGRTLTDERSIANGIGPVCEGRMS